MTPTVRKATVLIVKKGLVSQLDVFLLIQKAFNVSS